MSREELEKKAKEYSQWLYNSKAWNPCEDMLVKAFLAGAEEMQKENAICERIIIGEQMEIVKLEENRELKLLNEKMKTWINQIKKLKEENEQLKAQIMKMRVCPNCIHFIEYNENIDDYYACELKECDNLDKWEFAE